MFNTSMFMPRYLIKRTYEASEIHEREDGNMSGFLLALPAQTDNRTLKRTRQETNNAIETQERDSNISIALSCLGRSKERQSDRDTRKRDTFTARSISVAQTDNRVLIADSSRDKQSDRDTRKSRRYV